MLFCLSFWSIFAVLLELNELLSKLEFRSAITPFISSSFASDTSAIGTIYGFASSSPFFLVLM